MDFTKRVVAMGSAIGARELLRAVEAFRLDDALGAVGLERKPSSWSQVLPAIGLVTVSAAIGAGIALLLAPSSGSELRARLSDGIDDAKHSLNEGINRLESRNHRHTVS